MRKLACSPANAVVLPLVTLALLAGCSGEPKPDAVPPGGTDTPAVQPPSKPAGGGSAEASTPTPSASPSGSAKAHPKPSTGGGGTPAVIKQDATEITDTFGSRPAKIEIGSGEKDMGTLKLPEGALAQATNVTFKLDPKGKANGTPLGKIYHVITVVPPAPTPSVIASNGPPFELTLPAGNKKDANLAIGRTETDDKGKEKLKWTVIAPKRIDDLTGIAYFELTELGDFFLHITTKAPTEGKK